MNPEAGRLALLMKQLRTPARDAGANEARMLQAANAIEQLQQVAPIPMRLTCPTCNTLHIDEGEFATKPHHTHACQSCGNVWRPAVVATVGVRFLPGFKNGGGQ